MGPMRALPPHHFGRSLQWWSLPSVPCLPRVLVGPVGVEPTKTRPSNVRVCLVPPQADNLCVCEIDGFEPAALTFQLVLTRRKGRERYPLTHRAGHTHIASGGVLVPTQLRHKFGGSGTI